MVDLGGFDAEQVEPARVFEPLPAGKYPAVITDSEWKRTKSGNGRYLQFAFQVIEGPHKGRILWARLNLENHNATTVEIAQAELSAICRAVGVMRPRDSVELQNLPLLLNVACKKRQDTGGITNEIAGYEAKPNAAPVAAANGNSAPWGS